MLTISRIISTQHRLRYSYTYFAFAYITMVFLSYADAVRGRDRLPMTSTVSGYQAVHMIRDTPFTSHQGFYQVEGRYYSVR